VLEEALTDLVRFRFAPGRRAQRLFWQAHDWVASDDRGYALLVRQPKGVAAR